MPAALGGLMLQKETKETSVSVRMSPLCFLRYLLYKVRGLGAREFPEFTLRAMFYTLGQGANRAQNRVPVADLVDCLAPKPLLVGVGGIPWVHKPPTGLRNHSMILDGIVTLFRIFCYT